MTPNIPVCFPPPTGQTAPSISSSSSSSSPSKWWCTSSRVLAFHTGEIGELILPLCLSGRQSFSGELILPLCLSGRQSFSLLLFCYVFDRVLQLTRI